MCKERHEKGVEHDDERHPDPGTGALEDDSVSFSWALSSSSAMSSPLLDAHARLLFRPELAGGSSAAPQPRYAHAAGVLARDDSSRDDSASYPSRELGGVLASGSTGGLGALPGPGKEYGVATLDNLINRLVETAADDRRARRGLPPGRRPGACCGLDPCVSLL
jgi:hypothetical protein